ncbi:MAG: radical SAM protein [Thermodesulfovibrionales bacterium]|jgi:radical SAM superfamily enzyme YgiQ (UPF0313 family)
MKSTKVLLINSYYRRELSGIRKDVSSSHSPPLGLGYVGTYLRDSGCEVEILDPIPQGLSVEDILVKADSADYVGLSCYTDIRFQCFELAEKIKGRKAESVVIVGGPHAFYLDEAIMRYCTSVDIIIRGEGEETAREVVSGIPLAGIRGITYRQDGKIIRNPDRPFFGNIDDLSIDYSLMPDLSFYGGDIEAPMDTRRLKTAYLIESRGCPFQCSYCANDHWKRTWRATSAVKIVDKMQQLVERFGVQYFRFYDDLFTLDRGRVLAFCEELKNRNLGVNFRVLIRAGTDRKILEALKEAGCESVGFGIESGSDRMLRRVRKGTTRKQILDTFKACKEVGLWTVGSFIVSLPDETLEDFQETLSLTRYPDTFMVNTLMIFPYTPFYNELKGRGEIDDDVWFDRSFPNRIFYTKETFPSASFTLKELEWFMIYAFYYSYIRNPLALFRNHGFTGGLLRYVKALLDIPLKGKIDALYNRFIAGRY